MSVIAFPNLSPQGPAPSMSWELRSLTAINRSPLNAVVTTLERPGAHWAVRMPYQNLADERRARLQSFVSSARGHAQRFYVPVYGWTRRGSFPGTELLTNNAFASGTTGWSVNTGSALAAADGILRVTQTANATFPQAFQDCTGIQYAPFVARALVLHGRGENQDYRVQLGDLTVTNTGNSLDGGGMGHVVLVPVATTLSFAAFKNGSNIGIAGDFFELAYTSVSRCALVDNGLNALLRSDEIDNAAWSASNVTKAANVGTSPVGTSTAESLTESNDGAPAVHFISQAFTVTSDAQDLVAYGHFKANARSACFLSLVGSSDTADAHFNLSSGVVTGSPIAGTGWSNARAFIAAVGGGWYLCQLVARKTNSDTSITARFGIASPAGTSTYQGNGAGDIFCWRLGAAVSGVPVRPIQTTSAAATGTSQTGGTLHLKGLPASTKGLLLQGDPVEIITGSTSQLVRTRAPLDADAAGLGYFQFEPPLRISPSDNAAVIVHNPMCRMLMENNVNGWTDRIGGFADTEIVCVEDVAP